MSVVKSFRFLSALTIKRFKLECHYVNYERKVETITHGNYEYYVYYKIIISYEAICAFIKMTLLIKLRFCQNNFSQIII